MRHAACALITSLSMLGCASAPQQPQVLVCPRLPKLDPPPALEPSFLLETQKLLFGSPSAPTKFDYSLPSAGRRIGLHLDSK